MQTPVEGTGRSRTAAARPGDDAPAGEPLEDRPGAGLVALQAAVESAAAGRPRPRRPVAAGRQVVRRAEVGQTGL